MTKRASAARTSLCLLALMLSCASSDKIFAFAEPEPIAAGLIYGDSFAEDAESLMLLNRLKQLTEQKHRIIEQEHEITEEQIEIQAMLEEKAREQQRILQSDYSAEMEAEPEALPIPAAIVHHDQQHSGKRTAVSYMSLCHFKICNMGRKRQS